MKIKNIELGKRPLFLAPMEDVSDPPFRKICKELGADMMFTEFISSEGLIRNAEKSVKKTDIFNYERPVGVQIFGNDIESMTEASKRVFAVEPDVLDINFGCPVKKVVSKGCGAGILKDIDRMEKLTKAIVDISPIPVTVKTRLGWDENSIKILEVVKRLQDVGVSAISIHARTRSQMYKGAANWEWFRTIKSDIDVEIPIIANGDVFSPEEAKERWENYPINGMMIGRASIGNPWIFKQIKNHLNGKPYQEPNIEERIAVCKKHLELSKEWKGEILAVLEMRPHYSKYFRGLENFKPFKQLLMKTNRAEEIYTIFETIQTTYQS